MELTNHEKLTLIQLAEMKRGDVRELVERTGLDQVAVMRALLGLKSKGLVLLHEKGYRVVVPTDTAKIYVEKDLPERRALNLLVERGSARLSELSEVLSEDELKPIVGILRKEGWANVRKDGELVLEITEKGKSAVGTERPIEKALSLLVERGEVPLEEIQKLVPVEELKRRKIAEEESRTERIAEITPEGEALVAKGIELREEVSTLTPELIKSGKWREVEFRRYNISAPVKSVHPGKKQPYRAFLDKIRRKLIEMGFIEMTVESLIETQFWNFDALFQPQNHPAREWTDTYQLKHPKSGHLPDKALVERVKAAHERGIAGSRGWGYVWSPERAMLLMPRAHGTALSGRQLAKGVEIPGKYFTIQRVFRPDVLDRTHLIEFNQVDGFVVGEELNFRHLLGILKRFAVEIAGAKKVKFLPDYYPFTEPSVQMSAYHPELGWVEFGGAGIFREEMTRALGVEVPVIAWGIGIDRLAMFKLGIDDIRYLFSYDLRWLREAKLVW